METEKIDERTGEVMEVSPQGQALVFGTQEPQVIIEKATQVANRLADIVEKSKLYSMIKDKKYVRAEGWTTMAAMLGVFPSVEYCRRIEREGEIAYEAKVLLTHLSGKNVGAGEAICSSAERSWGGRDEYAVKSMAQTRALGKACRISFSWIMALAGYETCPAEEMVNDIPQKQVVMPKEKLPLAEKVAIVQAEIAGTGKGVPVPDAKKVAMEMQRPMPVVPPAQERRPLQDRPAPEGMKDDYSDEKPASKFFAILHAKSREKGVPDEVMKKQIGMLFRKNSSKELNDSQLVQLIKFVEGWTPGDL